MALWWISGFFGLFANAPLYVGAIYAPGEAGYIAHSERDDVPPLDWEGLHHGVFEPSASAYTAEDKTETFRLAWLFGKPYGENGEVVWGEAHGWHSAMRMAVKSLNEKRVKVDVSGEERTVRVEGHFIFTGSSPGPDSTWQKLNEAIVAKINPHVVFHRDQADAGITFERWSYFGSQGVMSFSWRGLEVEVDPKTGKRFEMGYNMALPYSTFAVPFFTQVGFGAKKHSELQKVAFLGVDEAWHQDRIADAVRDSEARNLDTVFRQKIPMSQVQWAASTKMNATTGAWIDPGDHEYWKAFVRNISDAGATVILHVGGYEAMSLLRAVEELKIDFGAIYTWWASADEQVSQLLPSAYKHTFTERRIIEDLSSPDVLYGTVGAYRNEMKREFGYTTFVTPDAVCSCVGSVLFTLFTDTKSMDTQVMNARVPLIFLSNSLIGPIKFGARTFNNGATPHLVQFGADKDGDPVTMRTVTPVQYAQQALRLPAPTWDCRKDDKCTCPPGKFAPSDSEKCFLCSHGRFSDSAGLTECLLASPGDHVPEEGASHQLPCPTGTFADKSGFAVCQACAAGSSTSAVGQTACEACDTGKYMPDEGQSECISCGGNKDTFQKISGKWVLGIGATSEEACGCKEGMQRDERGECVPCVEGMVCPGKDLLIIAPGFASDGKLSTYRCLQDAARCPGGDRGVCSAGRDVASIACSECKEGMTPGENGTCKECEASSLVPFVLLLIVFIVLLTSFYVLNKHSHKAMSGTGSSMVLAGILCAQVFAMLQTMGVLTLIAIDWREPLATLLKVCSLVAFDVDIIQPDCIMDTDPVSKFLTRIFIIVAAVAFLIVLHLASVTLFHNRDFIGQRPALIASIGTLFYCFFLSVTSSVLSAFNCNPHPNGKSTLWSYPSLLCWEGGQHTSLIISGCVSLVIPLLFLAAALWATYVFPTKIRQADIAYLKCWGFLFFRFRPQTYWYGLFVLGRSALIAVSPLLMDTATQVYFCMLVLLLGTSMTLYTKPWVHWAANASEILGLGSMLIFSSSGAFFVKNTDPETLSTFVFAALMCALFFSVVLAVCSIAHYLLTVRQKPFQYFLCHFKEEAGAFVRLLKMKLLMTPGVTRKVWLDSDDLQDLPKLFAYVASQTDVFVMIHTVGLLYRPWCIGEIVTAMTNNVRTVRVAFPGASYPSQDFINQYDRFAPKIDVLHEYGIMMKAVQDALVWLQTVPSLQLPVICEMARAILSEPMLSKLSDGLVNFYQTSKVTHIVAANVEEQPRGLKNIIIANVEDTEAMSTGFIIRSGLALLTSGDPLSIPEVLQQSQKVPMSTKVAIVVCTENVFLKKFTQTSILECAALKVGAVPILSDDKFRFPDAEFNVQVSAAAAVFGISAEVVQNVILQVFHEIAIVFNPGHYSTTQAVMDIKMKDIHLRMTKERVEAEKLATGKEVLEKDSGITDASSKEENVMDKKETPGSLSTDDKAKADIAQTCGSSSDEVSKDDLGVDKKLPDGVKTDFNV